MARSEDHEEPVFTSELLPVIREGLRVRCLSNRSQRQVYLVQEPSGEFRVFKVLSHQTEADLLRFDEVRRRLCQTPRCPWLLPVLAYGVRADRGLAWEELAVVDHSDPGDFSLDDYSPDLLQTIGVGDESRLVERVAAVGLELLRAIEHFSGLGLIHGDVKPLNVFRHQSKWVLGDYDSAALLETSEPLGASTEGYRPPGGGRGLECDTYALGKVLYELWTGNDRLEYPNLPIRLVSRTRWARSERLLNDLINALCSPVGLYRLSNLELIRPVLMALISGSEADQVRVGRWLSNRGSQRRKLGICAISLFVLSLLIWNFFISGVHFTESTSFQGAPLVATLYRHPQGENDGYVKTATLGDVPALMLFNTHLTRKEPLRVGDRVELGLRKEAWRGHVGVYLSPRPIFSEAEVHFGHREHFGRLSHHLMFHVDGDELVAPTAFLQGVPMILPAKAWNPLVRTNNLQTYWLSMKLGEQEVSWSVQNSGLEIANGRFPRDHDPCYLGIYVYDNTTCFLRWLKVEPDRSSGLPSD
jgi:hypothetical protein